MNRISLIILALFFSLAPCLANGQTAKKAPRKKVIALSAESLGKEFVADGPKAEKKYKDKTLRVTGTVASAIEEIVYLNTGARDREGQEMNVVLRFKAHDIPKVKRAQKITVEGAFDLLAVLGPSLKDCRMTLKK